MEQIASRDKDQGLRWYGPVAKLASPTQADDLTMGGETEDPGTEQGERTP